MVEHKVEGKLALGVDKEVDRVVGRLVQVGDMVEDMGQGMELGKGQDKELGKEQDIEVHMG